MRIDATRWPSPVPIAHRGSRLLWPENTLTAFAGAVELGYRHLETDLRITGDGVLVCIHDDTVDRTTDGRGAVETFSLSELKALDAGYRHAVNGEYPFRGQGIQIPTFEEVVTTFPQAYFVVDLKTDGLAAPLAELVETLDLYDRILVGSFSDDRIEEFRELTGGRVATSTGPVLSRLWVIASRVGRGAGGEAQALQLPTQLRGVRIIDDKLVKAAHDAGLQVHVWTVNREEEMIRLLDLGVDGLVTDRPDLLRNVLRGRGQWPWD